VNKKDLIKKLEDIEKFIDEREHIRIIPHIQNTRIIIRYQLDGEKIEMAEKNLNLLISRAFQADELFDYLKKHPNKTVYYYKLLTMIKKDSENNEYLKDLKDEAHIDFLNQFLFYNKEFRKYFPKNRRMLKFI
jgi:hypothetical protein